jgi:hypothetical protein
MEAHPHNLTELPSVSAEGNGSDGTRAGRCVGPNVNVAHKAFQGEAIADPGGVAPRGTGAVVLAGGPNTLLRAALLIGKAPGSLGGRQSPLPPFFWERSWTF